MLHLRPGMNFREVREFEKDGKMAEGSSCPGWLAEA